MRIIVGVGNNVPVQGSGGENIDNNLGKLRYFKIINFRFGEDGTDYTILNFLDTLTIVNIVAKYTEFPKNLYPYNKSLLNNSIKYVFGFCIFDNITNGVIDIFKNNIPDDVEFNSDYIIFLINQINIDCVEITKEEYYALVNQL